MKKIIFSKSSIERKDEYKIITRIYEEDGKKFVEKCAQNAKAVEHVGRMVKISENSPYLMDGVKLVPCTSLAPGRVVFPYIEGVRFDKKIDEHVKQKQWDEVWKDVSLLKDIIFQVEGKAEFKSTPEFERIFGKYPQLEGYEAAASVNLDMVAANIILADSIYVLDYEWNFEFLVPLKFILYRSIFLNGTLNVIPQEKREKLMQIAEITEDEQNLFLEMEKHFQSCITGVSLSDLYQYMPTKNLRVNEVDLQGNSFICRILEEKSREILYSGAYGITDVPEIEIDVKEWKQSRLEIMLADNPSILKLFEVAGEKDGKREQIIAENNNRLVWYEDYFFVEAPRLWIDVQDYEKIILRYRIVRLAGPGDDIISTYIKSIEHENELNIIKSGRAYRLLEKLKKIVKK